MFTDSPVTPTRLETLLDTLRNLPPNKRAERKTLVGLLQPRSIFDDESKSSTADQTVVAAKELGLVSEVEEVKLSFERKDKRSTRRIVLDALDEKVLGDTTIEPHFARFYSYLLFLNADGASKKSNDERAVEFEQHAYGGVRPPNPFNSTKLSGLSRWLAYTGLGWDDPGGTFQPNPYERIRRRLPVIFSEVKKLSGEQFISTLASTCPELDGGNIFRETNRAYQIEAKVCTLGLAHALVDLHLDGVLELYCPADSRGWSIERAEPPSDDFPSPRIAEVGWKSGK